MTDHKIISGMQILIGEKWVQHHAVIVADQRIENIVPATAVAHQAEHFPADHFLVPGFIDLHIHGIKGHDVMDGTTNALWDMAKALAMDGVTGFLATTMTATEDRLETVLTSIADAMRDPKGTAILGVHLEGPFISREKMGAQSVGAIVKPDVSLMQHWQQVARASIKLVTLAPELPDAVPFIQALKNMGIVVSIGHTHATYAESQAAIASGCTHATHLFNAMRGLHQREPGAAGALLLSDKVSAELIADGVHLHPAMVDLTLRLKGKDKVVLVTDAMRATCMGDGEYDLGGQTVTVNQDQARLADGTLAGSVLRMPQAIKNMVDFAHVTLPTAVNMASLNPARVLGLAKHKGSIEVGKDADLVVLNANLEVVMTMRAGKVIHLNHVCA